MKTKFKLCALIFAIFCMAIIFMPNKAFAAELVEVDTYEELRDELESGKSVKLMSDIQITGNSVLKSTRSLGVAITGAGDITIDGNGFTVSGASDKVRTIFEVYAGEEVLNVTFKDIIIENAKGSGRCIDTRTGNISLTLENSTLNTTSNNTNTQPLTIGGKYEGQNTINLIGTTISAGKSGYGIITFNPVKLTISSGSEVKGYGAIYLKGTEDLNGSTSATGAASSIINVTDSVLVGNNSHNGATNNFATVTFEDDNIKLNIENSEIGDPRTGTAYQYFILENRYGSELDDAKIANQVNVSNSTIIITDGILSIAEELPETIVSIKGGVTSTVPVEEYLAENVVCKVEEEKYVTYEKHAITIDENIANGTVAANVDQAIVGDTISLTVAPSEGYQLKSLNVYTAADSEIEVVDGKFVMPNMGAIVVAEFEKIPEPEQEAPTPEPDEEEKEPEIEEPAEPEMGDVDFIVPENKEEGTNSSIEVVETETVKETLDASLKADSKLNEKVEEARKNGEEVKVEIKMEALEKDTVKDEEKQMILQTVKANQTVHQYFDISVLVRTEEKELGKLTQLTKKMKFSMEISKDLIKEGREFYIIKLHDGAVIRIEAKLNGTKLEFETDQFSTFALAYEDVETSGSVPAIPQPPVEDDNIPTTEEKDDTPLTNEKDETPKTGTINIPVYVWLTIATMAVVGIVTTKKSSKHSR